MNRSQELSDPNCEAETLKQRVLATYLEHYNAHRPPYLRDHKGTFSGTRSIILTALLGERVARDLPCIRGQLKRSTLVRVGG